MTVVPTHVRYVGDGRCPSCGNYDYRCDGIPQRQLGLFRAFVDHNEPFTFAKTMPGIPHEYVVKERSSEAIVCSSAGDERQETVAFADVVLIIKDYGYDDRFGARTYRYLADRGFRYWTFGPFGFTTDPRRANILNRAPLTEEGKRELLARNGLS